MNTTPTETTSTETAPPPANTAQSRKRARLTKTLPTDRIPYARQLEIISAIPVAHEKAGAPITYSDVGAILGLADATLLQMAAFLADVGIVSKTDDGKFTPSNDLLDYYRVHKFSPEKAWVKLAPLFERSWFGREIIPRLKLRTLSESEALLCLAEVSGAEKDHEDQLKVGLEYLRKVGLIVKEGSQFKFSNAAPAEEKNDKPPTTEKPEDAAISGLDRYPIFLDAERKKQIVIFAPPSITKRELRRVQMWLRHQLVISDIDDEDYGFVESTQK